MDHAPAHKDKHPDVVSVTCLGLPATTALAERLAALLHPGDVVLLEGTLAAGKTTFVAQASRSLGVTGQPASPTYVISHVYDAPEFEVYHIDAYRLADAEEFEQLGLDEFFPDAITFIEWGDRVAEAFDQYLKIDIALDPNNDDGRQFRFTGVGGKWASRIAVLAESEGAV